MNKLNITKGKWRINPRASLNVQGENGISICSCSASQNGENTEQEQANALFIVDAGNTYNETEMLPSELAANLTNALDLIRNYSDKLTKKQMIADTFKQGDILTFSEKEFLNSAKNILTNKQQSESKESTKDDLHKELTFPKVDKKSAWFWSLNENKRKMLASYYFDKIVDKLYIEDIHHMYSSELLLDENETQNHYNSIMDWWTLVPDEEKKSLINLHFNVKWQGSFGQIKKIYAYYKN